MRLKKARRTPLCWWVGGYFAAWAALGRAPLPCRAGAACFAGAPRCWVEITARLRGAPQPPGRAWRAGGAREPRPCPGGAGVSLPVAGAPSWALGPSPLGKHQASGVVPGDPRPARPGPALQVLPRRACRACSRFLKAAASRPLPALPSRPLPPLPAARPEFPSPAPAGPSSGHCPRSLRPGHTRPPAGERPAPLGFVPNSASALLPLPPAPR